jgi:predicted permease
MVSRPGFSIAAILPLALAIASVASVVTLVDAVLFRSMGLNDPASLVTLYGYSKAKSAYLSDSYPEYKGLSQLPAVVESATAYVRVPVSADLGGGTERLATEIATGDYFQTLGVRPAAGRPFGPEDDRPDAAPVALVSDALFHRNPAILGSTVRIGDVPFTVIGAMPRGYAGTLLDWGAAPSLWLPMAQIAKVAPVFATLDYRNLPEMRWLMITARLKHEASVATLQAALDVESGRSAQPDIRHVAIPSAQARFFPSYREAAVRFLGLLAAVSGAVLSIACFNLMNLLLARAAAREKETSTRLALGAGRARISALFLTESLLLALTAVAVGVPLSYWLTGWLSGFRQIAGVALNLNLRPDALVLVWSIGAGLAAGALAGAISAARAGRVDILSGLNRAGTRPRAGRLSLRDLFVAAQVACAAVVLISASTVGDSLRDLREAPAGYGTHNILLAALDATNPKPEFFRSLLAELRTQVPGAALAWQPLPSTLKWTRTLTAAGSSSTAQEIEGNVVSDGFFQLLGTRIEAGREFLPADNEQAPPVILLNRTAAERLWPGQYAIGRSVRLAGELSDRRVAGVAQDVQVHPLASAATPYFYVPLAQVPRGQVTLYLRAPVEFTPVLRSSVSRLDRRAALYDIRTMQSQVDSGLEQIRLAATSTTAAGLVGTVLALAGVFAVTAWRVVQQRRDMAIRIALGAGNRDVLMAFVGRILAVSVVGAGGGAVLAIWTANLLRMSIRGVHAPHPLLYLGASAIVLVLVLIAAMIPARQILRIDPATLLRVQ